MRFEDSPELFGYGVGGGTTAVIICGICGNVYNEHRETIPDFLAESVRHTTFAGIEVCECCYEKVETEILHRMFHILKWYRKIVDARWRLVKEDDAALKAVTRATDDQED
jgi:hypothetical protein